YGPGLPYVQRAHSGFPPSDAPDPAADERCVRGVVPRGTVVPIREGNASPGNDSLLGCCRFPPAASPSPDDPGEFPTVARCRLSPVDCVPRSIRSPTLSEPDRTASVLLLLGVVPAALRAWPCGKYCFYPCNGPRDVHTAVTIPGTFASSLPWCRARCNVPRRGSWRPR